MIHNAYDTHGHSPSFIQSQIKKMQLHQLQKYNQKTQKTQTFLPKGQHWSILTNLNFQFL